MRIAFTLVALAVLCATPLHAGPETLVKERAKKVRDQNNARQGVPGTPPPSQPAVPPPATTKPAASKPTPAARIKSDLISWQSEKSISADLKKTFNSDLLAAVRGSKSPSSANVEKFTDSLATALGGRTLGASELSRLVQNINLALNSAGLSEERRDEVAAEVQADLESAGTAQAAASAAARDLKAVMTDLSL